MLYETAWALKPLRVRGLEAGAVMSIAALAAGVMSLGCDGGTPEGLESPHLAVLLVSPAATQLELGQTQALELIALDQFGNDHDLSDSDLTWSTGNAQVAAISGDAEGGLVTAMDVGSTVIRAWADGVGDSAFVQVLAPPTEVTIAVRNELVEPVAVEVDGVHRMDVPAGAVGKTRAPIDEPFQVTWSLIRPTSATGAELGEPIGETFPTVADPRPWMTFVVDAKIGKQQYFSPRVRNGSGEDLLIGVNMDLPSEHRCDCVVSDGMDMSLGYYPLLSGANVRGYGVDEGYTDALCAWDDLELDVDRASGSVILSVGGETGLPDPNGGFRPLVTRP